ncbi:hypothetical protein [Parvibaculum sp.]|uniref:hypothetical protein n=1 Tax=Parvibaculum sp. TaxID=2024848 RepID=UPI000C96631E|nr:hypothetical protein [Parvibaculum sp.]MAB15105.1 hypothetical protein [Parvibaculum sp.]
MKHFAGLIISAALLGGCTASGTPSVSSQPAGSAAPDSIQLGVTGDGGVLASTAGDVLTPLLGDGGALGNLLGGGESGVLGGVAADAPASPLAGALPADQLAGAVGSAPALGVSGAGGLGEDLLGYDAVGGLIGTEGGLVPVLLSGGSDAPLGGAVPAGAAPLGPVGDGLETLVTSLGASSRDNNLSGLSPILTPVLFQLAGASDNEGGGPFGLPIPLPDTAIIVDPLAPVLIPVTDAVFDVAGTRLPTGQTVGELVNTGATGAGIVDNLVPLTLVTQPLADALP